MKERAERLGGRVSIRSRVGEGTEVNLTVPAHLLYQDDVCRCGWRLGDGWYYLTGRLGIRKLKPSKVPQGTPTESGSETRKPDKTNP